MHALVPLRAHASKRLRRALFVVPALTLASASLFIAHPVHAADVAACIASSEQALALRKQGKLHGALQQLAQCADPGCPAEVSAECTQRIGALKAAMPTLILAAKDGSGNDLYDVKVSMDGAPLTPQLDGRPLSIDPGEHAFHFETAGQPPLDKRLVLREGEQDRRETLVLGPVPASPLAPAAAPEASPTWWTTRHTLVVASGGLGVVGVALGAVFGGFAISSQNRQKSDCGKATCNLPQAQEDYNVAGQDATASTVAFVAGGAFLAAAGVLWFTQPPSSSAAPAATTGARWHLAPGVGNRAGSLVLRGEF